MICNRQKRTPHYPGILNVTRNRKKLKPLVIPCGQHLPGGWTTYRVDVLPGFPRVQSPSVTLLFFRKPFSEANTRSSTASSAGDFRFRVGIVVTEESFFMLALCINARCCSSDKLSSRAIFSNSWRGDGGETDTAVSAVESAALGS